PGQWKVLEDKLGATAKSLDRLPQHGCLFFAVRALKIREHDDGDGRAFVAVERTSCDLDGPGLQGRDDTLHFLLERARRYALFEPIGDELGHDERVPAACVVAQRTREAMRLSASARLGIDECKKGCSMRLGEPR